MTNRLGVVVCLHTELTQLFGRHIVQDALPLSRHFLNVCLRPERLETFVNFQCETVSDSESARALSESARVRPRRDSTLSEPPPPDKRCGWLRCVPTFWDASSRSCTEDAYVYTRGTNNRPHTKHLSRKLTKRVHSTYHPLATSYTTDALTAATQELAAHSKLVELQVEKGKIVPLSSCWQLS